MHPRDPRWNGRIFLGLIALIVAYFGVKSYNRMRYPIHQAVLEGNVDRVLELAKEMYHDSTELNKVDGSGHTPLSLAVSPISRMKTIEERLTVIRILVNAGADVNARGGNGCTALHAAVYWSSGKTVKYPGYSVVNELLAGGANPYMADDEGETPIDVALKYQNRELATLLESHHVETTEKPSSIAPLGKR
jgi:ankyrin repeat protein